MKTHGIGVGYRFPHDYEGDDIEQQYLPDDLVGQRYYVPGDQGQEVSIGRAHGGTPGGTTGEASPQAARRPSHGLHERRIAAARGEPQEARRDAEEGRGDRAGDI